MSETTLDGLLGGALRLHQPRAGHRAGTDGLLVVAAAAPEAGSVVVDAGSGVGAIGLALALRAQDILVRLVEREAMLADLASANATLNGLAARVSVHAVDLLDRDALGVLFGEASLVVSNPPFFAAGATRPPPDPLKARAYAHMEGQGDADHGGWLRAMLRLLRPHGRVLLIHRPEALPALLAAAEGRLGSIRIRPIQPREGEPATRILFGGVVGSRAPFAIADPLVVHAADGGFSPLMAAISRGEVLMPLFDPMTRKSRPGRPAFP